MALARAFIDLHHLTTPTSYYGDDFQLIVDDGNGNPVWANGVGAGGNGSIDETTYTDFQTGVNGENTVARQAIAAGNNGPFGGFSSRGVVDTSNGYLKMPQCRIAYTIMDNNAGVVDPSAYVYDGSVNNLLAIAFDRTMVPDDNKGWYEGHALVGGMFCTAQGKPKIVTINTNDTLCFGLYTGSDNYSNMYFISISPVTYPATQTNPTDGSGNFLLDRTRYVNSDIMPNGTSHVFEYQIDLEAGRGVRFEDGGIENDTMYDIDSNYPDFMTALRNNYFMPVFMGLESPNPNSGYDYRVGNLGFEAYNI